MTSEDTKSGEEMMAERSYSPPGLKEVWGADPEYARIYDRLSEYTIRGDDALSRKHRELFIVGFAATQNRYVICRNHIEDAYEYGATDAELLQMLQLATHIGGAPTMLTAAQALDELGIELDP